MLQRFIDSYTAEREWTVQGLIVDHTQLVLISAKLVLQKHILFYQGNLLDFVFAH